VADENGFIAAYAAPSAGELSAPLKKNSPFRPTHGVPSPNMRPQPTAQNENVASANTTKFFARMLTQFLARQRPLSTKAKPAFIQNTSMPATMTHTVSVATRMLLIAAFQLSEAPGAASCAQPVAAIPTPASASRGSIGILFGVCIVFLFCLSCLYLSGVVCL